MSNNNFLMLVYILELIAGLINKSIRIVNYSCISRDVEFVEIFINCFSAACSNLSLTVYIIVSFAPWLVSV
jgi:hypothetical protein